MTATASSLSALSAAARVGDWVAMLLLADLAEEAADLGPAAWEALRATGGLKPAGDVGFDGSGRRYFWGLWVTGGWWSWTEGLVRPWNDATTGAWEADAPPEVRDAVLAACRQALSP